MTLEGKVVGKRKRGVEMLFIEGNGGHGGHTCVATPSHHRKHAPSHPQSIVHTQNNWSKHNSLTPLEKRTQVWFELQEEISYSHEFFMKMLPENRKIKKIYRGTYTTDV